MSTNQRATATVNPNPANDPTPTDGGSAFTAAYERRLPEIVAVPDDEFATINLDVNNAVTTVLGVMSGLTELADALLALPGIDPKLISGLSDYAMAAGEANTLYMIATAPPEDVVALNEQAMQLRETFRSDATALANRGLIPSARLEGFKGLVGYKNVAFELMGYADLMKDCWTTIQGKTPITAAEIDQAKQVGERLVVAAGQREQNPAVAAASARIRQQALTLLLESYDETRRGVVYLRWHLDDADKVAPSLYAGRGGKKPAEPQPTPPSPTPPTPPTPTPVDPTTGAVATHPAPVPPVGHPNANPFGVH